MNPPSKHFSRAFTFGACAAMFIVAGLSGYNLSRHSRFVAGTPWSDAVIWWEVALGIAALPLAAYFARLANRAVR